MKKGSFASKEKRRSCYNCDESGHFSDTCPYEKRQDKPKYAKAVRTKLKPNPMNLRNKNKLKDVKALLGVEYTSDVDEEESGEEDIIGVAGPGLYSSTTTPRTTRNPLRTPLTNALCKRRLR
jgi:hypothetical protein